MLNQFLGHSPKWFKFTMIAFLIINIPLFFINPTVCAWLFIGEFIFCLAMALKCYPLQSGGILAIEAVALGLTTPKHAYNEISANLEVVLLLVFMVAGIYFMKPLLMFIFSKVFTKIKSKTVLSLLFVFLAAVLSAFLDALTVTAVLISVAVGFYGVYHKIHSSVNADYDHDNVLDRKELSGETFEQFKSFLRSLIMHGVVGTALGGVCTLVGEPQNLLIGERLGWDFVDFFLKMAPITLPVLASGLLTTVILEQTKLFGFGDKLPEVARRIIEKYTEENDITVAHEVFVKSSVKKSKNKILIIQQVDKKINLEAIAQAQRISLNELIKEMEHICHSGTKLNLDYYIDDIMDEERQDDIYDYFMEADSDDIEDALEELGDDYSEEEIKLIHIKFISEVAN